MQPCLCILSLIRRLASTPEPVYWIWTVRVRSSVDLGTSTARTPSVYLHDSTMLSASGPVRCRCTVQNQHPAELQRCDHAAHEKAHHTDGRDDACAECVCHRHASQAATQRAASCSSASLGGDLGQVGVLRQPQRPPHEGGRPLGAVVLPVGLLLLVLRRGHQHTV
jgi:hypothetical protein